jgi:hypothetical protein
MVRIAQAAGDYDGSWSACVSQILNQLRIAHPDLLIL